MPQVLIRPGLLDRLKEVRGLTDQAMADIGHVSLSTYRRYRDRETQPSGEFIARTCLATGLSAGELIHVVGDASPALAGPSVREAA